MITTISLIFNLLIVNFCVAIRGMEKSRAALYWQKHKRVAPTLTKSRWEARGTHRTCFL